MRLAIERQHQPATGVSRLLAGRSIRPAPALLENLLDVADAADQSDSEPQLETDTHDAAQAEWHKSILKRRLFGELRGLNGQVGNPPPQQYL